MQIRVETSSGMPITRQIAAQIRAQCASGGLRPGDRLPSVRALAAELAAEISWKPILVGGVFNAVNQDVYERRANPDSRKAPYSAKDLQDWARLVGIKIVMPPPVFPVRGQMLAITLPRPGYLSRTVRSPRSTPGKISCT